ncbi:MAG: response regulator [Limisphaerales bacterium]
MKKILIIEDDLIVRTIYRRKFEMAGYRVETAEEGAAGLKMIPDFQPDLIQVDIMLPGIDGVEVIRQIRSWPEYHAVPILVLSSFYRPDLAQEAWKAGATKCVSKMDCTPSLALDLIEQLLSGEATTFVPKYGTIPMPRGPTELRGPAPDPAPAKHPSLTPAALGQSSPTTQETTSSIPADLSTSLFPKAVASNEAPQPALPDSAPLVDAPKLKLNLDLPPTKGLAPTRPIFGQEPPRGPAPETSAKVPARAEIPGLKTPTRPTFARPPAPAPAETKSSVAETPTGSDFRLEIRQEFLRRAPQIQAEVRDRVSALMKSNSTTDQFGLLHDLDASVHSLASLAGITGFSRIAHLAGAMSTLIRELHKKPAQMTSSVLRTIAHAADCLNQMFRDLNQISHNLPQSLLILVVDDEPISRRTISLALSKANLRCVCMEDSLVALSVLKENAFDLVFLDAEMPGMSGFDLCAELRKLPTNKSTPVIFVTSLTKFEVRAQSSLSGGNDLIAKPFLMMELAVKALTYLLKPAPSFETAPKAAEEA